jgi:peptidoglycan/LPS O-acetylase OafA/YrhL
MEYRRDIEGLRAVAVVPIVLFHAGIERLSGGFLGVDVFFVISGFLITTLITEDISSGSFSLLRFYSRRAIRILPALLLMLAMTVAAGAVFLFPAAVDRLGKSAAAAAAFVSNIYFWRNADYFAPSADLQVFLHTWSLGVEEQYYIFYPLFLIVLTRLNKGLRWGVAGLTIFSFLISFVLVASGRDKSAFYLLPPRMWELSVGGLVAIGAFPRHFSQPVKDGLSLLGFCAILVAFLSTGVTSDFAPSLAIMPCVGSAFAYRLRQEWVDIAVTCFDPICMDRSYLVSTLLVALANYRDV